MTDSIHKFVPEGCSKFNGHIRSSRLNLISQSTAKNKFSLFFFLKIFAGNIKRNTLWLRMIIINVVGNSLLTVSANLGILYALYTRSQASRKGIAE